MGETRVNGLEPWWVTLLRQQQRDGFPDLAGSEVSATIPITDRLVGWLIAQRLPATAPIRELSIVAHRGNELTVRVRLAKPAILPPIQIRLAIEQQPELPASPFLVLGVVSQGVAILALNTLRFTDLLPPGVRFDGRRFIIDVRTLLERHAADLWSYLLDLAITIEDGRVVVHGRAALPVRR
jgi:hypothetical protein